MSADDAQALGNLASGVAALTGADVCTLHSVQLKGTIVAVEPASSEDLEHVAVHTDAFFRPWRRPTAFRSPCCAG